MSHYRSRSRRCLQLRWAQAWRREVGFASAWRRPLEGTAERQIDAHAPNGLVTAILQLRHAVIAKARRAAPHGDIAMPESELIHRVVSLQASELEYRRQTQRHGNDRIGEVALVLVLVQRQVRTRLIAVDQACVGTKLRIAGFPPLRRSQDRGSSRASPARDCPSRDQYGRSDSRSYR